MRYVMLLLLPMLSLLAADPVVTTMVIPGKLLHENAFSSESFKAGFGQYGKGDKTVVDDQLRMAEKAEDKHMANTQHVESIRNVVVRVRFKFDGNSMMGVYFLNKEHVAALMLYPDRIELHKKSGIGPTTKKEAIDKKSVTLEKGTWYTARVEWCGQEILAQVDDLPALYGKSETFDIAKDKVSLVCAGKSGMFGWYDDFALWDATIKPDWTGPK